MVHYTPKHAFWINQVEIWLGILRCELLRRSNFRFVRNFATRCRRFIDRFNRTMAKPSTWTSLGTRRVPDPIISGQFNAGQY